MNAWWQRNFLMIARWGCCLVAFVMPLSASTVTWIGDQNDNWHVGLNWSPNWECGPTFCIQLPPQPDDDAIVDDPTFGTLVELSAHANMRTLEVRNGMFVDMNGYQLAAVDGLVTNTNRLTVDGFGSQLRVAGGNPNYDLYTNRFRVANGGLMRLVGSPHVAVSNALASTISSGGIVSGNGTILFDNAGSATQTVLTNDGTISVRSGTLTLGLEDDGLFDLDGALGAGVLSVDDLNSPVSRALTLNVEGPLTDNFDGTLTIGKFDRAHFTHDWRLGRPFGPGSRLVMNGYDGTATLSGAPVIMDDGLGRVEVNSGTARIESDFAIYAGRFVIQEGTKLEFAADSQFNSETVYDNGGATHHELLISGSLTINNMPGFDWDGPSEQHVTTVDGGNADATGGPWQSEHISWDSEHHRADKFIGQRAAQYRVELVHVGNNAFGRTLGHSAFGQHGARFSG